MNYLLVFQEIGIRGGEKIFLQIADTLIKNNKVKFITGNLFKNHHTLPNNLKVVVSFLGLPFIFFTILNNVKGIDIIISGESPLVIIPSAIIAKLFNKKLILLNFEFGNIKENYITKFFAKFASKAITVDENLLSFLKNQLKIEDTLYIPIPIDLNQMSNAIDIKYFRNKFVIFMPGIIHPAKNQDVAIKTLHLLNKKYKNILLVLSNQGKYIYKKKLINLVNKLNLQNKVIFQNIDDKHIKNYYKSSSVVLMCGPIGGLTIAEASFFNKLAIYPTSGNPPNGPVEKLGLGVIIKKNNPFNYSKIVSKYIDFPTKFQKKIKSDKKIVDSVFSYKKFTKNIMQFAK